MSQQYAPAQRGQQAPVSFENQILAMRGEFARAIGGTTPAEMQRRSERFARICVTAFRQNAKLQQCSPVSILGAMMTCAQLGLEPNTPSGLAYLIPRWNGKLRTTECQFQVGYRGLLELMYRSGAIASINADVVYRQEIEAGLFSYTSGIRPSIEHRIDLLNVSARTGNPADIVAAYACAVLKSGEPVIRVVPRPEIDKAMSMSGGKSGPSDVWKTHYAEMAIKTAIHRLAKWLPSTRVDEAFDEEAKYAQIQEQAPAPQQPAAMSLDTLNAMLAQPVVEQAQAIEQEPEPAVVQEQPEQPKPAPKPAPKPQPAKQDKPAPFKLKETPSAPAPQPAPAPEPEPVQPEPVQEPAPVEDSRISADIDEAYFDYVEGNGMDIAKADGVCRQLVNGGACANMTQARELFVSKGYTV